jgi:5-methylcytosine-specific restriction enzyme A
MSRSEFTGKIKLERFLFCGGRCERCTARLYPGKYRFDHDIPDGLGGEASFENCRVVCLACDTPKTARDVRQIAKAKRQQRKHVAPERSRNPLPCGRRSKHRKKITGEVVLR